MNTLLHERSLDEWYKSLNRIYLDRNFYRSLDSIFLHFIEVVGSLNVADEKIRKKHINAEDYLPKALAWFFAYCGRAGIPSISTMIWAKFPAVCPYCHRDEHKGRFCKESNPSKSKIDWEVLREIGQRNIAKKPVSLKDWQRMFNHIYPRDEQTSHSLNIKRLGEECSETAEAIRVISVAPQYIISEAPDIFAWLMGFANQFDADRGVAEEEFGDFLEKEFYVAYPDLCKYCGFRVCKCPAVPPETLGRIAKEAPLFEIFPENPGLFSLEESIRFFSAAATELKVGDSTFTTDKDLFKKLEADITSILGKLEHLAVDNAGVAVNLAKLFARLEVMATQGSVSQADLDRIIQYVENQPSSVKQHLTGFFVNLVASGSYSGITVAVLDVLRRMS